MWDVAVLPTVRVDFKERAEEMRFLRIGLARSEGCHFPVGLEHQAVLDAVNGVVRLLIPEAHYSQVQIYLGTAKLPLIDTVGPAWAFSLGDYAGALASKPAAPVPFHYVQYGLAVPNTWVPYLRKGLHK